MRFNFTKECPTMRSCEYYLRVHAVDREGNEQWHNETLVLFQEVSACTADCLAVPLPGRYVASRRGINGCEFYGLESESEEDKGTIIADLCHLRVEDSWVSLNSIPGFENQNQELQCPRGPIRTSRFTQDRVTIDSESCDNMRIDRRPIRLEGEEIIMNVIVCD